MSNNIEVFNNSQFGSVRVFADENGEPCFVAADVCRVLGYDHTPHATRLLDDDEKGVHKVDTLGGTQEMTIGIKCGRLAVHIDTSNPLTDAR